MCITESQQKCTGKCSKPIRAVGTGLIIRWRFSIAWYTASCEEHE